MLQAPIKRTRDRVKPSQVTPVRIASVTKTGSVATIVFNQSVSLKGVPAYTTNLAGVTATAASMTNPTTLSLTFSGAITTATTLNIPFQEPAIRNAVGGFVADTTFPVT
jgi:hypothetical protein